MLVVAHQEGDGGSGPAHDAAQRSVLETEVEDVAEVRPQRAGRGLQVVVQRVPQRDRVAAQSLAEADKIKRVTQAEAEAESKRLQGEGVAAQRKAIALGIAEQYEMLRKVGIENSAEQLLLMWYGRDADRSDVSPVGDESVVRAWLELPGL